MHYTIPRILQVTGDVGAQVGACSLEQHSEPQKQLQTPWQLAVGLGFGSSLVACGCGVFLLTAVARLMPAAVLR